MQQVLIIDDSMVARMALKNYLKETGAATLEAGSGEEALALLQGGLKPGLVFLDLTMPGMGGVETLKRIRGLDAGVKVVVVTADVQGATLDQLRGFDVFEVLRKPTTKEAVRAAYSRAGI